MRTKHATWIGLLVGFACMLNTTASASALVALPDAVQATQLSAYDTVAGATVYGGTDYGTNAITVPGGTASVINLLAPLPVASATAAVNGTNADATSALTYFFRVVGPDAPSVPVDILRVLIARASADGNASAGAGATLIISGGTTVLREARADYAGSNPNTDEALLDPRVTFDLKPNTDYTVQMNARVTLGARTGLAADGYAFVDPYFQISAGFADAASYVLAFSDGIGNVPPIVAVPAPPALPLFALAVLALGTCRLHRNKLA